MEHKQRKRIIEGALMAAGSTLTIKQLSEIFDKEDRLENKELAEIVNDVAKDYQGRGLELHQVASGYRFQVCADLAPWVSRLWEERPPRYSRALLETLALIAYKQPITRSEIEEVRGVAVSSNIVRTLMEREWIKIAGHKDVPGRPALFVTTNSFLDYFNLKNLKDMPSLTELSDLDQMAEQLELQLQKQDQDQGQAQEHEHEQESDTNKTATEE